MNYRLLSLRTSQKVPPSKKKRAHYEQNLCKLQVSILHSSLFCKTNLVRTLLMNSLYTTKGTFKIAHRVYCNTFSTLSH